METTGLMNNALEAENIVRGMKAFGQRIARDIRREMPFERSVAAVEQFYRGMDVYLKSLEESSDSDEFI